MIGIAETVDQPSAWVRRFVPLIKTGELLEALATLTVIAFEQGEVAIRRPAVVQRIAATAGPLGRFGQPST
jgi:hypothetical protein